ncbi:MAG: class I SAM-dependent methyltransferase [Lysobacterales bacterium]|jgi:SAM-dependent methyltransferase
MTNSWLSYGELAWTESILAPPGDCVEETEHYADLIREHVGGGDLLHLACGAGGNDFTFKKYFTVIGVDISREMLDIAENLNPEVRYVHGDMRSVELGQRFDAVVIPDSIDYAATLPDLEMTIATACGHLKPGGVLLVVAKTREEFRANNFCYTGERDGIEVTVFENNHVHEPGRRSYEANLVYLIRRNGKLKIYTDRHVLGLFSQREWLSVLQDAGLSVRQEELQGIYDRFILGEGHYPMRAYIGIKPA